MSGTWKMSVSANGIRPYRVDASNHVKLCVIFNN